MNRIITLIAGLLLLLSFAQCKKVEKVTPENEQTFTVIQFIDDNLQTQLDRLSDLDTPDVLVALSEWVAAQEGVRSVSVEDNSLEITFVDETSSSIDIYDESSTSDSDFSGFRTMMPSRSQNMVVVGNQKAFIWDAFPYNYPGIDMGDSIYKIFNEAGCEITRLREEECTVEALRQVSQYGYVHLITHGAPDRFATGERVTVDKLLAHLDERALGRVRVSNLVIKKVNGYEYKDDFFVVTDKFIKHLPSRFDNAIVFNTACKGMVGNALSDAFLSGGAATYLGFDNSVYRDFSCPVSQVLTMMMLDYGYTIGEAYDYVCGIKECNDYNKEDEETGEDVFDFTVCFKIAGNRDVSWYSIPPVSTNGLVAYYPFNGNANDESGNGNDGILSGDNVPAISVDRHGRANSAYEFGGYYNPNWIRVPNSESLQFDHEMTISFWIQQCELAGMDGWGHYSTTSPGFAAICKAGDGNATYPGLYIMTGIGENGEGLSLSCNNSNGNAHNQSNWNFSIGTNIPNYELCQWLHIALIVSDEFKALCVNGIPYAVDQLNKPSDFTYMNQQDLFIGVMGDDNPTFGGYGGGYWYHFNGKIDDIRIYNRALSPMELKALYAEE